MARSDPTIYMRIPQELKEKLDAASEENRRSLTAEVVARLNASFTGMPGASDGISAADEIADKVAKRLETTMVQPISLAVLREKYLRDGNFGSEEMYMRVARALMEADEKREVEPRDNTPYGPLPSQNSRRPAAKRIK